MKGLGEGLGIPEASVSSPTFVLANEFGSVFGGHTLHHEDFYRLEHAAELETMGFFDMIGEGRLLAVEWGEKFSEELPGDRMEIQVELDGGGESRGRRVLVAATGAMAGKTLEAWKRILLEEGLAPDAVR